LKRTARGLKDFANYRSRVRFHPGKPDLSPHHHAIEIPEEPGNSAAGKHWRHDPGRLAIRIISRGVTDYFQV
jgi:hypothetical protein